MNPKPSSSIESAICAGVRSSRKPSSSRTSALPESDETERLPCLATPAPAAAATSAAAVEMLKVLLALQAECNEETADLSLCRLARHDRVHHPARLVAGEILAVEQLCERVLDHRASRKFRTMSRPCGVSTDSGWNCTPSSGSSRWRTAITSPSAAVAETSNTSGTVVAASEW
jgi:hypothetical protein